MKQLYQFVFGISGEPEPRLAFKVVAENPVEAVRKAFEDPRVLEMPAEGSRMGMECLLAYEITP